MTIPVKDEWTLVSESSTSSSFASCCLDEGDLQQEYSVSVAANSSPPSLSLKRTTSSWSDESFGLEGGCYFDDEPKVRVVEECWTKAFELVHDDELEENADVNVLAEARKADRPGEVVSVESVPNVCSCSSADTHHEILSSSFGRDAVESCAVYARETLRDDFANAVHGAVHFKDAIEIENHCSSDVGAFLNVDEQNKTCSPPSGLLREFPLHFTSYDYGNSSKSLGIGEMNVPCTTPETMVFDQTVSPLHDESRCNGSTICMKNKGQSTQIDITMVPCLLPKSFLPVISYLYSMQYGDTADCDNEDRFLRSGVRPCNEVPNCHSGCISAIEKAYDAADLQNGKHNVEENGGQGIHETASVVNHDYSYLISPFQNKENQGHNEVQTGDILIPEKCGYYDPNDLFKREAYSAINKANDANHLQNGKGNIEENQGQGIHETASVMDHDCFHSISPFQDKENQDHSEVQTGNTLAPVKCNYYDPNVLFERENAIKGNDGNHSHSDMGGQVIISDHEISSSHDDSISETQIMAKGQGSSSILVHKMHTIEEDVDCNHEKKALDEAVDDHSHASSKAWSVPILYDGFENTCFKNEKHAVKGDVDDHHQAEIEKCISVSVNASNSTIMENKEEALEKDVIHIMLNGNNTILHKDLGQANTKFWNVPMYDGFEDACFQNEKYATREDINGHHQAMIGACTVNVNTLDSAIMENNKELLTKDVSHIMLKGNNVIIERNLDHHSQNEIESLLISSNDASDAMHPEDKEVSAPANVDNKDQHDRHENEICVNFSDCNETEINTTQEKKVKDDAPRANLSHGNQGIDEYVYADQEQTVVGSAHHVEDNLNVNNRLGLHVPHSKTGSYLGVVAYDKPHNDISYTGMSLSATTFVDGMSGKVGQAEVACATLESGKYINYGEDMKSNSIEVENNATNQDIEKNPKAISQLENDRFEEPIHDLDQKYIEDLEPKLLICETLERN